MSKTQQAATPKSEVQIVEFQQQTRSEPLEIPPLALSLPSSVQEELMKDDFIYVPPQEETQQTSNNDCPQEAEKQGVIISLTSSIIEDLMKDDYVYEVSNEDPAKEQEQQAQEPMVQQESQQEAPVNVPAKEQEQQAQEPTVQQESQQEAPVNVPLEQPCEEPTEQQSKQEAPVDVCPPEPNKQGVTGSITSSVIEQFFKDAGVYQVSDEEQSKEPPVAREREDERPSFSLRITPPASQPTQPSQESDSQLEILAEAVIEDGVEAALKFAEGTSSGPTLPAAQAYKTP
nr:submandibular gland secretory Glx-rich protein CA-like [Arachis hypogaea]